VLEQPAADRRQVLQVLLPLKTELKSGRYTLRGVLGEGAQGMTYDAVDGESGRPVAIKRFDVRGANRWKDVELAEREARVLSTIDHPLVPRYLEHFEEDGALYLVMEKIEGETLEALRRRHGPLPEAEVRRFLADADRALTYLHGRSSPVVHRDIKPRNVVRRENGSYVLVDFGAVSELLLRRAGASTVVGTMGYMAPEQLQGRAMPETDVYAVGATALAALTGQEPETLPHRGLRIDVEQALRGRASPSLAQALARMTEPDPDHRAKSLAAALDGVRDEAPAVAPALVPMATVTTATAPKEDGAVKSIRKLLWLLWGLGWVIVPATLSAFHAQRAIPAVMFTSLAMVFILTWHKGAAIRMALRALTGPGEAREAPPLEASTPVRQRVAASPQHQVRVHATEIAEADLEGQTERESVDAAERRQARRL
jgi:Protein kinase domain